MALVLKDRVLETCSAPGTGAVTLLGAVTGYQAFSTVGNGNTCYYAIADQSGSNWEVGIGTYATSGNTLTRTTILSSSNAGSTVNFATGTQNVFLTYPSERSVNLSSAALTSGRVTYATTDGLLTDNANMTFNGTTLTLANDASISGLTVGKGGGANADNTALGASALFSNSTGTQNVAVGKGSFYSATSANFNTGLGFNSGYYQTGVQNTAIGLNALYGVNGTSTGVSNVAVGFLALTANTSGSSNTSVGTSALQANTTASNNTAVGYQAGYSNTTGTRNVFIGNLTGNVVTTDYNTMVGSQAGQLTTTGNLNTFIGVGAGSAVTSGSKNTILGGYGGNQGGLDIRTATGYIVLADGDGNPRQVIDGSGNVGIGTGSPGSRLDVKTVSTAPYIRVTTNADGAGSAQGGLQWFETNSSAVSASITGTRGGGSYNQTNMIFSTADGGANTERMRIDSTGNVGIGLSNPSAPLEILSTSSNPSVIVKTGTSDCIVSFKNTGSGGREYWIDSGSTGAGVGAGNLAFYDATASATRMVISSAGNVGIGTTSPAERLDVAGNIRLTGNQAVIFQQPSGVAVGAISFRNSAGTQKAAVASYFNIADEGALEFVGPTGNTNMLLNSSGNLGLGVTPSAFASGQVVLQNKGGYLGAGSTSELYLSQNVFYGGSPAADRYVNTGYASSFGQTGGAFTWRTAASGTAGNAITFTQAMTLDNSGRLAIGSTSVTNGTAFGGGGQVNVAKLASSGYPCLQISTTSGGGSSVQFTNSDTVNGVIGYNASGGTNEFTVNNSLSGALTFGTNNTERARIDSSGNVGIGTTAVYNSSRLSVAGNAEVRGNIKSYSATSGGIANGATLTVFSLPSGSYGASVGMVLYIQQRNDNFGNLTSTMYMVNGWGGSGAAIGVSNTSTYAGGSSFTLTATSASGNLVVTFTNTSGVTSTSISMTANVIEGYSNINWGF